MIIVGDSLQSLKSLPDGCVRCCVTSPPYWGLRDYGHDGQIGLERTPDEYVARIVEVFREVRRVLADDGTLWLNLGDSYASTSKGSGGTKSKQITSPGTFYEASFDLNGLKPKDLVGIPWRVAFALQADGWWLRQDIIWHKPNPMPESVTDRCTKAHEYVFLLAKSERYYFDAAAIHETSAGGRKFNGSPGYALNDRNDAGRIDKTQAATRNKRSVWTITTQPFREAHFAVMPEELARLCVVAGSKQGDTVLDPFSGAGTVGVVAEKTGRKYIGCELNPEYAEMAERRIRSVAPIFGGEAA